MKQILRMATLVISLGAHPLLSQIAPSQRLVVEVAESEFVHSIPELIDAPFMSYAISWQGSSQQLQIRFSNKDGEWDPWINIEADSHLGAPAQNRYVSKLYTETDRVDSFQLSFGTSSSKIRVHFFNPGYSASVTSFQPSVAGNSSFDVACDQPSYLDRDDWCSNCPGDATPQPTEVSHIIVHHSAGTNSANDWGAIVRAIWDLHVNTNGWDDIGYNWLIDPDGIIYEGRGNDLQGAHFCSKNSLTMGVCLLGTFTNRAPTDQAISSLRSLLAWKSTERNIDPDGSSLHAPSEGVLTNISGHRDGCSTACPGDRFYPLLDQIRLDIAQEVALGCNLSTSTREWHRPFSVEVMPNPVRNQHAKILIRHQERAEVQISIIASNGERLLVRRLINADRSVTELPLTDLPSGIYFLRVESKDYTISKKIIAVD